MTADHLARKSAEPRSTTQGIAPRRTSPRWPTAAAALLALIVLATLIFHYTEPVRDTDLWWQMAYGRDMLARGTLIPDHTAYTWTPTAGSTVYCAWLTEILLYLLHRAGGLPLLFALRYLCLLTFLGALVLFARRHGLLRHPVTWLVALLGLLMSSSAAYIKPEIFSYVFLTLAVWLWLSLKHAPVATAVRRCYLFPLLMLVWVNSHGGVIFGALFYALVALGETLNGRLAPEAALAPRVRRHLWIAIGLSAIAFLVTPYGIRYPLHLATALPSKDIEVLHNVRAYLSVVDPRASHLHYLEYMAVAAVILLGLLWGRPRRRRFDWALLLVTLAFAFLYTRLLRTTYLFAPVFALGALHLLARRRGPLWPERRLWQRGLLGAALALSLVLGGRAAIEAVCRPVGPRWFGFGVSYHSPVAEAEFIRTHYADRRLGNDYATGGYLLWALAPETPVMIDPRSFPFEAWHEIYSGLSNGRQVERFLRQYPCEVFCAGLERQALVTWFLRSDAWRLAFYGPSAAVFIRGELPLPAGVARTAPAVARIRNIGQALLAYRVALSVHDFATCHRIVAHMQEAFRCPHQRAQVAAATELLAGTEAYYAGEFETAAGLLLAAERRQVVSDSRLLVRTYNHLTIQAWTRGDEQRARQYAEAALAIDPRDANSLFNAGAAAWYLERQRVGRGATGGHAALNRAPSWSQRLQQFLAVAEARSWIPESIVADARCMLAGTCDARPQLAAERRLERIETW